MSLTKKIATLTFIIFTVFLERQVKAGGLNIPSESNGGKICEVTSQVDEETTLGSLRRAMNQGYNVQDSSLPSFCTEKIVFKTAGTITLHAPIELNNKAASGFTLEKDPSVTGQVILDASGVGAGKCAIILDSNQVTVRGITIRNAPEGGICIKGGSNGNIIDQVTVTRSANGVEVESGSQNNLIENGAFFDNTVSGVNLVDATQNNVTKNAIYRNGTPVISPATDIQAQISSASPSNSAATNYTLSGTIPNAVDHCEVFRGAPSGSETNYITDVTNFSALSFNVTVDARSGEDIFLICIAPDGTTSPASTIVKLTTVGSGPGNGPRACFPGQVFPPTADFDGDGIYDINEDKNSNCVVDPGETDPTNKDTDGDGIEDGIEDRNKNGVMDAGESNPANDDSDGDHIKDGIEDKNHNGIHETDELDPANKDTDNDGITDDLEDINKNGIRDGINGDPTSETDGTLIDTDHDGKQDGEEDINFDGVHDKFKESDPRITDTDDDGFLDGSDVCPNIGFVNCKQPCIPGQEPDKTLDSDGDKVPDFYEDRDHSCGIQKVGDQPDAGETNPYKIDTDNDGKTDGLDSCPNNVDPSCEGTCDPLLINEFTDSDSDGLVNNAEDKNGNCLVDPGESDPFNPDSDHDGITDGNDTCKLDPNPLCNQECQPGVKPSEDQDSDGDGIPDINEDIDNNCVPGPNETDFRKRDTDSDGINDNNDPCPINNPDVSCVKECVPGEFIPPQRDSDKDGIKDVIEDTSRDCIHDVTESDAYNADSDGDGISDGVEDVNKDGIVDGGETDPRYADTDGDGITDGLEDKNHNGKIDFDELDPKSTDTDGDGIPDQYEDRNLNGVLDAGETNGARKDTDQDGLDDGAEDKNHNGIVDAGETDAKNPDTDGDGVTDGQEVTQGTNPINASTSDFNKAVGKGCSLGTGGTPDMWYLIFSGTLFSAWIGVRRKKDSK